MSSSRRGEAHCGNRCVAPRCKGLSKKSGFVSRCCLCTRHASGLCHWHRRYDGPQTQVRGPARAAVVGGGVDVRASTLGPAAGNGLFATVPFASNDIITEYDGVRLAGGRDEARRQLVQTHIAQKDGTYVSGLRQPQRGRGGGSFANDPGGGSRSYNATLFNAGPHWGNRLFLKVKPGKVVRPGDEIFLNYGTGRDVAMGWQRHAAAAGA